MIPRAAVSLLVASLALTGPLSAQAAAPEGRFAAVDAMADAAPASAEQSVATLGAYLTQAGPDELTRARALYRWVTGHINYDVNAFRTANYGDLSPEGVLRQRSSVCEGYARLSQALGAAMGLQVEVVSGWSKGYGYAIGQRFDGPTNHAWVAVRIDGQWRLMDPTWGAGYLDERMQFVRRFQEHYFLTPPEAFVFDHLPQDPRWQLLDQPVSAADYAELAYLRPMFFGLGFGIVSHPRARITTGERLTVTLRMTQPAELKAILVNPASDQPTEGEFAFSQAHDSVVEIRVAFPRAGDYLLRLFAKPAGAAGALEWVLDYRVQASRGTVDAVFPVVYSGFSIGGGLLLEPFTGVLQAGRTYTFRLRAPRAIDVAIVAANQWTHLARNGDEFTGSLLAVPGDIIVFAKYDTASNYAGLLKYVGH